MALKLHRDGILEDIFYYLWQDNFQLGHKLALNIPDTVIYRFGNAHSYYFTSKQNNQIMKKKEISMKDKDVIIDGFLKHKTKSGIIAYFLKELPRAD